MGYNMTNTFKNKYLKYKLKYLQLKKKHNFIGGETIVDGAKNMLITVKDGANEVAGRAVNLAKYVDKANQDAAKTVKKKYYNILEEQEKRLAAKVTQLAKKA